MCHLPLNVGALPVIAEQRKKSVKWCGPQGRWCLAFGTLFPLLSGLCWRPAVKPRREGIPVILDPVGAGARIPTHRKCLPVDKGNYLLILLKEMQRR